MKKYNNVLFEQGIKVIQQIEAKGFKAYFVGGCVRDYIMSLPIKDIDLTTSATPEELKKIFPKLIPIGIEHGTVLVRENHMSFEITTYRDGHSNPRFRAVGNIYSHSLEGDLMFRDFTMNALAMDCNMNIIDFHNGQKDLEDRVIRAVGNPLKRMHEDPLRIMRGIRFMSQFGFSIEEETIDAMEETAYLLESVATERLLMEFEKIFTHSKGKEALKQLADLKIDQYLPVFREEPGLLLQALANIKPLKSFAEVIAVFHILAPHQPLHTWCNQWKCSNQVRKNAKKLVHAYINADEKGILDPFFIYTLQEHLEAFYRIYTVLRPNEKIQLDMLYNTQRNLSIKNRSDLAIGGSEITHLFPTKKPGKWINELLTTVEYKVVTEQLPNEIMTLKEWITCNPPETN